MARRCPIAPRADCHWQFYLLIGLLTSTLVVGATDAAEVSWQKWQAGSLTFEAPAVMRLATDTQQKLIPFDLNKPDWTLKIVDAQQSPSAVAATFEWSPNVIDAPSGTAELTRAVTTLAGRSGIRLNWRDDDVNWRGFDVIVHNLGRGGALFKFTCHAPTQRWRDVQPMCERMAASIQIFGTVAANPPAPPPPSHPPTPPPPPHPPAPPPPSPPPATLQVTPSTKTAPPVTTTPDVAPPPPQKTVWSPPPRHEVLFSGKLDSRWEKLAAGGGDFASFARLDQGGLIVDVPAGHSWGNTGLQTALHAGIFLDEFGAGARQTFTFRFDPSHSQSFVIAIVGDRDWCSEGGQPPGVGFAFAPKAEGAGAVARWFDVASNNETRARADIAATGAQEVRIVLTPGKASATVDGTKLAEGAVKNIANQTGYAICVFAQGRAANLPSSVGLREIVVDREPSAPEKEPKPALGVAPLPLVPLLGAKSAVEWETVGLNGGDFTKFGKLTDGRLAVSVPAGDGWRNTGVLSKTPIVVFDTFAAEAPYRLQLKFDPQRSTDFVIQMMSPRTWDRRRQFVWLGVN